ncbi:hypothetical protein HYY75_00250 [bacterium]|nr:hypothetical protein [bacterium]
MKTFYNKFGMALVVVLMFATALLILGANYIQTFTHVKVLNPKVLDHLKADFYAQGLQKIALLKYKKFPADFYHAIYFDLGGQTNSPQPWLSFHEFNPAGTVLAESTLQYRPSQTTPLGNPTPISSYTTSYRLLTSDRYKRDSIEIKVVLEVGGKKHEYSMKLDVEKTL